MMNEMFDLTGKTALVTGSNRGIGKAILYGLAEAGANVILHCRKPCEGAERVLSDMQSGGFCCEAVYVKPHPEMLVYSALKSAASNLVAGLSSEFAPYGVTVNNIAPGTILTDRNSEVLADREYLEKVRGMIPMGFIGEPCDIAGCAVLLASEAGHYITGQNIFIDGGKSAK